MLNKKWVAGWGTADTVIAQNQADYIRDQSFRWVIYSGMKATSLRFRFSKESVLCAVLEMKRMLCSL